MKNIIKNCFNIIFLISFVYILYNAIFQNQVNHFKWDKYIVIIGVLSNLAILLLIYKYVTEKTKINTKILIPVCFIIIFFTQCIVGNLFKVLPNWDIKELVNGASAYLSGNDTYLPYLYRYSNNITIQIIYIVLFKIADIIKIIDVHNIAILFNIIMIDIGLLLTYFVAKKIFDEKKAFIIFLMMACMTPIYLYVPIVYTDTLSLLFPLLILYLYLNAKETQNLKKKILLYFFMGLATYIGICIKFTVIIILISIIIYEILNFNKKELIKLISIISIVILLGSILSNSFIKLIFKTWNEDEYNKQKFPITHWIMMGLKGKGKYNEIDVKYTSSFETYEEKKENNIEQIKKRLKNLEKGKFIKRKLMYTWGDGTYYAVNTLDYDSINNGFHQELVFKSGKYHQFYKYYTQIQHISIITLMIIVTIASIKKEIYTIFILRVSIFGLFIFLLIWETRSRYLVNYLPIMQIIAFSGMEELYKIFKKRKNILQILNKKIELKNISKYYK